MGLDHPVSHVSHGGDQTWKDLELQINPGFPDAILSGFENIQD